MENERQVLTGYREIAEALIKQHMSHKRRDDQMVIFWQMIEKERDAHQESEYCNTLTALMEILKFITCSHDFTHHGVKSGLSLFVGVCQVAIERMYDKTTTPAQRLADDIPF